MHKIEPKIELDWVALRDSHLWLMLWDSEGVNKKLETIRGQLLKGHEVDAHTLGKLRGQIDGMEWLHRFVHEMAERQLKGDPVVENREQGRMVRRFGATVASALDRFRK